MVYYPQKDHGTSKQNENLSSRVIKKYDAHRYLAYNFNLPTMVSRLILQVQGLGWKCQFGISGLGLRDWCLCAQGSLVCVCTYIFSVCVLNFGLSVY